MSQETTTPIEILISREKSLAEYSGPDQVVEVEKHLERKKTEINNRMAFSSSFAEMDDAIEGLQTGELAIVSGPTGNGKTLFAAAWVRGMVERHSGMRPLVMSFEVNTSQFFEKYLTGMPMVNFYCPDELKAGDPQWVIDRIWEATLKYQSRVVIIDHLHYVIDMNSKHNMSLNIGAFVRELKLAAQRLNVAIILIAHQGQPPREKDGDEASMSNIRDSSFIGQEADLVFVIVRRKNFSVDELMKIQDKAGFEREDTIRKRIMPDKKNGDEYGDCFAIVKIEKARRAGTYRRKMLFQKRGGTFEQV